jgi:hypothetical protein
MYDHVYGRAFLHPTQRNKITLAGVQRITCQKSKHSISGKIKRSLLRFENNLLYLHLVEQIVTFDGIGKRHYLVGHETTHNQTSAKIGSHEEIFSGLTYPSRCCFFCNISRACGKIDRTGHLPIWMRRFLP